MVLKWHQKNGLLLKIVLLVFTVSFSSLVFLSVMTHHNLKSIIEKKETRDFRERLRIIHATLSNKERALQKTGLPDLFLENYQKDVVQDLRVLYYDAPQDSYPFIIDADKRILMHPSLEEGFSAPFLVPLVDRTNEVVGGYEWGNEKKWIILKTFEPWGWTLGFSTPESSHLSVQKSFTRRFLLIVSLSVALLLFVLLFSLRHQVVVPLMEMRQKFADFTNPDVELTEKLRQRRDDIGELARSFHETQKELIRTRLGIENKNKELREALSFAEAATSAKGMFLANMSHEIRTPLNGVIGMTELLKGTDLSEKQKHYTETLRRSGESLLRLVNDILDFSKIESEKMILEELDFDLQLLLDEFCGMMAFSVQEKGLEFLCVIEPEVPTLLRGDSGRLLQILFNLTGNAAKFTESGEVAVRVSLESMTEQDATIHFSVTDTGIGIPSDKQDHIFQFFTQVDASTTRKYGGTGLGLAITGKLVDLMGGTFGLESTEQVGSEFWFTVPLEKQKICFCETIPPSKNLRGLHVLVVDDNPTNREILVELLTRWGAHPEAVSSGEEALTLMRQLAINGNPFRMAILDMHMPEMDGVELGRLIRADEQLTETLLVMMTSLEHCNDIKRFESVGFDSFMTKPVRPTALFDILVHVLHGKMENTKPSLPMQHVVQESWRQSLRILLAEDNFTNQIVAKGLLEDMGFSVDVVSDGEDAVKAVKSTHYDVVFMDVQMPRMDGMAATREIRKWGSAKDVVIIAMTAHAMQGDRKACLVAGMNDYITKPFSGEKLLTLLEAWFLPEKKEKESHACLSSKAIPKADDELIFDRIGLCQRMMGNKKLARFAIDGFVKNTPSILQDLSKSLAEEDEVATQRHAHSIKGSSSMVGAIAICTLSEEMEAAARDGDLLAVQKKLPKLKQEFERFKETVDSFSFH